MFTCLSATLSGISWELIFVDDDSPDNTFKIARDLAQTTPNVRVIQRIGRKGLASACIEGMLASSSSYVAVMDADLQHDEQLLPEMLKVLKSSDCSVVSASRYMENASTGELSDYRVKISQFATKVSNLMSKDYAETFLESLPQNAVVFTTGDIDIGTIGYFNQVELIRPDVTIFSTNGLVFNNRLFSIDKSTEEMNDAINQYISQTDRPVFFSSHHIHPDYPTVDMGFYYFIDKHRKFNNKLDILKPEFTDFYSSTIQNFHETNS